MCDFATRIVGFAYSVAMNNDAVRLDRGPLLKLSIMMFLQYAIWGAWLPLFYAWLTEFKGFSGQQAGTLFGVAAIGALIAPFLAGQIADRWFATEKFLALSHLLGAVLIWMLPNVETYTQILVFGLLYSILYSPTLSLTNSIAFHHIADSDRDFSRVRLWGTVGWIVVGIGMGQWLLRHHLPEAGETIRQARVAGMTDAFRVSAVLGGILGVFCFFLPHTPPAESKEPFAAKRALVEILLNRKLLVLFLVSFPISCVHQFYFVRTEGFLGSLKMATPTIDAIFGVGGGPMTIGQISEIAILALIPFALGFMNKKWLLLVGLAAYALRFFVFAHVSSSLVVFLALALHGLCFGCFFFVAFMIVDEETTTDVRATAQSFYSLIIFGLGVIVGNFFAGYVDGLAGAKESNPEFYQTLFGIPMWVSIACFAALFLFYPLNQKTLKEASRTK